VSLIATEVAEALEHVTPASEYEMRLFQGCIIHQATRVKQFQRTAVMYADDSVVKDTDALLEELADTVIRVLSYVGGNGWAQEFDEILRWKMEVNASRDRLHGKGF
jgi:NTP pyrophosphatase (non-canonical NTP hydrolase)